MDNVNNGTIHMDNELTIRNFKTVFFNQIEIETNGDIEILEMFKGISEEILELLSSSNFRGEVTVLLLEKRHAGQPYYEKLIDYAGLILKKQDHERVSKKKAQAYFPKFTSEDLDSVKNFYDIQRKCVNSKCNRLINKLKPTKKKRVKLDLCMDSSIDSLFGEDSLFFPENFFEGEDDCGEVLSPVKSSMDNSIAVKIPPISEVKSPYIET